MFVMQDGDENDYLVILNAQEMKVLRAKSAQQEGCVTETIKQILMEGLFNIEVDNEG